ncbi:hypothetical protein cypCar_00036583 [Cyprinus carpio]|nr:hypothetical protein cypCar_00036583 [Cyprinus carpio]
MADQRDASVDEEKKNTNTAEEENDTQKTEEKKNTQTTEDDSSTTDNETQDDTNTEETHKSFRDLVRNTLLCEACDLLGWKKPTKIQIEAIPVALEAVVVGGIDMMSQALVLAKKPHVVIATPGRLIDHLENTKGFNLRALKYLVMDEADRILNMDFESEVDKILKVIPRDRRTFLFSATMTKKVQKLQRAALQDPVKCTVSSKYATVDKLQQYYIFIPSKYKNKRLGALNKFKSKSRSVLLATDVASRGLDIPHVDCVINFDIPTHSKDYIHRVGRTARAGRSGKSITFVTQYDVELFQRIEALIGKKLPAFPTQEEEVMMLLERVSEAQRFARIEMKESSEKRKRPKADEEAADDGEQSSGVRKKIKGGSFRGRAKRGR